MALAESTLNQVTEVASGIDALYLSGQAEVPVGLAHALEEHRDRAADEGRVPFEALGDGWSILSHSFGKHRWCLDHPSGRVGLTASETLPTLRVQPRAELLHGVGPEGAFEFFRDTCGKLIGGPIGWKLSRLDLFCDVQGWQVTGDDRHRFVCRSERRDLHERGADLSGFEFGRRTTKTICARVYDKTLQVDEKGIDWWHSIWGDRWDPALPVLRVEFEIGRQGLKEFGITGPTEGIDAAPRLWAGVCEDWLTYRSPTGDATKSRWPIAPEWAAIQRATLRQQALGLARVRAEARAGSLRRLTPALVGYLSSAGALLDADDLEATLGAVRAIVHRDEQARGRSFADRIAERRAERP